MYWIYCHIPLVGTGTDCLIQHKIWINANTLRVNNTTTIRFVTCQSSNGNRTYLTELLVLLQAPRCIGQDWDADIPSDIWDVTRWWPNPWWFLRLYFGTIDTCFQFELFVEWRHASGNGQLDIITWPDHRSLSRILQYTGTSNCRMSALWICGCA